MSRTSDGSQHDPRDGGFTLIELVVVAIILGILVGIAIPVYLNQRHQMWTAAVESDVRNAAIALETRFVTAGDYDIGPGGSGPPGQGGTPPGQGGTPPGQQAGPADLTEFGLTGTSGVELRFYTDGPDNEHQSYCIEGRHERITGQAPVRVFLRAAGGFVDEGACPGGTDSYAGSFAGG